MQVPSDYSRVSVLGLGNIFISPHVIVLNIKSTLRKTIYVQKRFK